MRLVPPALPAVLSALKVLTELVAPAQLASWKGRSVARLSAQPCALFKKGALHSGDFLHNPGCRQADPLPFKKGHLPARFSKAKLGEGMIKHTPNFFQK
jgi:hypothetical protein